jgi:hypothetical protein
MRVIAVTDGIVSSGTDSPSHRDTERQIGPVSVHHL